MRHLFMMIILCLVCAVAAGMEPDVARVQLHREQEVALSDDQQTRIAEWAVGLLQSANCNTANHPEQLGQSVHDVQTHYRAAARGDYVVVTWPQAREIQTMGGAVTVSEIIIGLTRPDGWPSALFTVDPDGRIVAHEKHNAVPPADLRAGNEDGER